MPIVHCDAGKTCPRDKLVKIPELMSAYYTEYPNPEIPAEKVSFGTSGHRGSSISHTFNEEHIYAITQAVCDYRKSNDIDGPLFIGADTHALSEAALRSALEVLVANDIKVFIAPAGQYTATPAISHAILRWNAEHSGCPADGIIITPSHNPPRDGGFKYNPPHGGPAETAVTVWIENTANRYLENNNHQVMIKNFGEAIKSPLIKEYDYTRSYVEDIRKVLDMDAISSSGLKLGVDPLGGASLQLWEPIAESYNLELKVVNDVIDPTFSFVPCDKDGQIRMDCSSAYAMGDLLNMKDRFDLSFACDPDSDRHGIVTSVGLMNPNHYLSVAAWYLLRNRPSWNSDTGIGKTIVTTGMLDRIGADLGRSVIEVPVGFKWFVPYLYDGKCGMGCEESAGASFLCFDRSPWTTDKDGPIMCLLAAEITARMGKTIDECYKTLTEKYGTPFYQRLDAPADDFVRARISSLSTDDIHIKKLGGKPISKIETRASGNTAPIGGVKISSNEGWFAIRPSGTEAICKIYTESFAGMDYLLSIQKEAMDFMEDILRK